MLHIHPCVPVHDCFSTVRSVELYSNWECTMLLPARCCSNGYYSQSPWTRQGHRHHFSCRIAIEFQSDRSRIGIGFRPNHGRNSAWLHFTSIATTMLSRSKFGRSSVMPSDNGSNFKRVLGRVILCIPSYCDVAHELRSVRNSRVYIYSYHAHYRACVICNNVFLSEKCCALYNTVHSQLLCCTHHRSG